MPPLRRPSLPTILAGLALFVALGGPAEAKRVLISTPGIKNGAVTGAKLHANAVTAAKVKNGSLGTADLSKAALKDLRAVPPLSGANITDGTLSGADLAPGSIAGDRLAADSVSSPNVVDNSLTTNDIGANAIQSDEVANNTLTGTDVKDGSLDSSEITDGGLNGKDVGRFAGELGLNVGALGTGDCTTQSSTSLTPVGAATQDLSDDAIVVTPPSTWPDGFQVTAFAGGANLIKVVICNLSGAPHAALGEVKFRYLSIDTAAT